jgi:hypothetical protein
LATTPHTASILMISWPGRYRSTCSRISVGSSLRRDIDVDMGEANRRPTETPGNQKSHLDWRHGFSFLWFAGVGRLHPPPPTPVLTSMPSEPRSRKRQKTGKYSSSKSKSRLIALEALTRLGTRSPMKKTSPRPVQGHAFSSPTFPGLRRLGNVECGRGRGSRNHGPLELARHRSSNDLLLDLSILGRQPRHSRTMSSRRG